MEPLPGQPVAVNRNTPLRNVSPLLDVQGYDPCRHDQTQLIMSTRRRTGTDELAHHAASVIGTRPRIFMFCAFRWICHPGEEVFTRILLILLTVGMRNGGPDWPGNASSDTFPGDLQLDVGPPRACADTLPLLARI